MVDQRGGASQGDKARDSKPQLVEDDPHAYTVTRQTVELARKVWAQPLWRGIIGVLAGVVLLIWPANTLTWILWILLGLVVLDAVITLIAALTSDTETGSRVGVSILALLGVAAAIAALVWSDTTAMFLRYVLAVALVTSAVIGIVGLIRERKAMPVGWELRVVTIAASLAFTAVILLRLNDPNEAFGVLTGLFLIFFGVTQFTLWVTEHRARVLAERGNSAPT